MIMCLYNHYLGTNLYQFYFARTYICKWWCINFVTFKLLFQMIVSHLFLAFTALIIGSINLFSKKGTQRHKFIGWFWIIFMTYVAVSSFLIKELNDGVYSWIHLLSIITLISLILSIIAIKLRFIKIHSLLMIGTYIGLFIAGMFALMPGRYIANFIGI